MEQLATTARPLRIAIIDHRDLSKIETFLHGRNIDYVTYQDWKILDQYEVACGTPPGPPRLGDDEGSR